MPIRFELVTWCAERRTSWRKFLRRAGFTLVTHLATFHLLILMYAGVTIGCSAGESASGLEPAQGTERSHGSSQPSTSPTLSFTFDDGITSHFPGYPFDDWNARVLEALRADSLQAIFFVTGTNKLEEKGERLLASWAVEGHGIANYTWSHPYFHEPALGVTEFERELVRTDSVISATATYTRLFRFPYLKEGDTQAKVQGFRQILRKHNYRNGHVTIDASDWYYNDLLVKHLRRYGPNGPKVEQYKAAYIRHILERADYYEALAYDLTGRHIPHTPARLARHGPR